MNILLVLMNIIVLVVAVLLLRFMQWSGPGFALGIISGVLTFFIYTRLKLGYWI